MNKIIRLVATIAAFAALTGCAVPKFLVADGFNGGRNSKTILRPAVTMTDSKGNKDVLYDYIIRLCDLDAVGVESNCGETVVLTNLVSNTVY